MEILNRNRCIIGECPIWNAKEKRLYHVDGYNRAIQIIDPVTLEVENRYYDVGFASLAFDGEYRLIGATGDGVYYLNDDGTRTPLYDREKYSLRYCNDMKVGPDGRIYVGTQSEKRYGAGDKIDGKLYSIDKYGEVKIMLDGLILSNGLDFSADGKYFYHTDSDTHIIKEYEFDTRAWEITPTGREVYAEGVDGFIMGKDGCIYAALWGKGRVARIDTRTMAISAYLDVDAKIPASCAFFGEDMDKLAVTTASYGMNEAECENDGFTLAYEVGTRGFLPNLFGG